MKKIRFRPNVPTEVRAIDQRSAITILEAIHRYAENGAGHLKPLSGEFEGVLRLRVGNHRVIFEEIETPSPSTASATAAMPTSEQIVRTPLPLRITGRETIETGLGIAFLED